MKQVDVFLEACIQQYTFFLCLERKLVSELPVSESDELICLLLDCLLIHQAMQLKKVNLMN
jgi:hypothetical protein